MNKVLKYSGYVVTVIFLLMVAYVLKYSMGTSESFEVNPQAIGSKMLIATQKSEYKDDIVRRVIENYKSAQFNIKVIDINQLDGILANQWAEIIVIHTWEYYNAPKAVRQFIKENKDREHIFTLATSGDGHYHLDNVDGITSASRLLSADEDAQKIIDWIDGRRSPLP